ncbi:MAG: methyl-accepting chemotaxis protein [Lachnospiraceae bacterium]|nr:methyl-accepting chemotaxis protein [Lachnospiraceae bacterium]
MKRENRQSVNTISVYRKLRTKLIASFLIPVLCIIILGVVSYQQASKAIIANYENSVSQTMNMTNQYITLAIDTVRSNYKSYLSDEDLSKYFKGLLESTEGKTLALKYTKEINRDVNTNDLICNISFISDDQVSITSAAPTTSTPYSAYAETPEGALVTENRSSYFLFGNKSDADPALGADSSEYSLRLAKHLTNGKGIMLIDYKLSLITDSLSVLDAGEGSYAAIITQDGTELYSDGTSTKGGVFSKTDFYQTAAQSTENGMEYVSYNGEKYLFVYSPISTHAAMICALIPEATILAQVANIKAVAVIFVVIAVIIAALLGCILSGHINHNIYYILKQLKKVAAGDLTIQLKSRSKDEFKLLADGVNSMADSMKTLITNVTSAGNALTEAAEQVSASSNTFVATAENIQRAILEIDSGVTQLDDNSADCLAQMDTLSGKINDVTTGTDVITTLTESTGSSISTGIASMNTLTDSARKTSEITDNVIQAIEALSEKSRSIGKIVESINSIARETNLLSLNASIEAARAGESGRGFAVVAEQIRQLADQSASSAGEIQTIIDDIIKNTGEVVTIAKEAESTVSFQEQAVAQTTESFLSMDKQIHSLLDSVAGISANIRNMENARNTTLNAIEGISAISAQTAAGSSNVNATVDAQREAITTLDTAAGILQERATELTELLKQFTI